MLLGESLSTLLLNDSIGPVTLVGDKDFCDVGVSVLVNLLEPILDVVECLLVSAVVH